MGVDTVSLNQNLYQLHKDDRRLLSITWPNGNKVNIRIDSVKGWFSSQSPFHYSPQHRWWEMNVDSPFLMLGMDYDFVLTKNSRVIQKYVRGNL